MLEQQCFLLDIKLVCENAVVKKIMSPEEYNKVLTRYKRMKELEYQIKDCQEKIQLVNDTFSIHIFTTPEKETENGGIKCRKTRN